MKTLYDLLEALPDDDADGLRAAFRKAAKANHPDFNPGNAEASERFRRIVRANAILSDGQQRAEYDRLLEIAKRQQTQEPRPQQRPRLGTFRRFAADAIAIAVVSAMTIGGYFAYKSTDRLPLASASVIETSRHVSAEKSFAEHDSPAKWIETDDLPKKTEARITTEIVESAGTLSASPPQFVEEATQADNVAAPDAGVAVASAHEIPAGDYAIKDVTFYRERGTRAYRNGDLYLALANFDLAIDLDPGLPESYLDRGIVFHRLGDLKRALSDVAEAKRIEAVNRNKLHPAANTP
jgi:tetratricopeptide (TPR) repeat protein